MSRNTDQKSATTKAELLLKLSNERKLGAERLVKHEFRALMSDLDSGDFLLPSSKTPASHPQGLVWHDSALLAGLYASLPALNVPIGAIAVADQGGQLPNIGIFIPDERQDRLKFALMDFFGEHHNKPFCNPVFLTNRLDILPFFRRFGFAVYYENAGWDRNALTEIRRRHGLLQVRELIHGSTIH